MKTSNLGQKGLFSPDVDKVLCRGPGKKVVRHGVGAWIELLSPGPR